MTGAESLSLDTQPVTEIPSALSLSKGVEAGRPGWTPDNFAAPVTNRRR
ncbi:hypothetical protein SLT36_32265 (plasmid) [Aminobacter sp. BA135]